MISSVKFENFKALSDFSISLRETNILTGPNNNGKSTILDAFRILQGAYRGVSRRNPSYMTFPDGNHSLGYEIPDSSIPIILNNIQTDYSETFSRITFFFKEQKKLIIAFSKENKAYLYFDLQTRYPKTSGEFRTAFPLDIAIIPTLGPFEVEEELLDFDYVNRWIGSRRASRMFRSFWFHYKDLFQDFKYLVESTWEGMSINIPERKNPFSKELCMFCVENHITREICWAGFGFQIWLQLLTHIVHAKSADLLIIDEPEIYLHPDLQHKVLDILKKYVPRLILATHSVEIINSVEASDVVIVDKTLRSAKRIADVEGLQKVNSLLGSMQNIHLARLAKGKKILFVEGKDIKLLSKFFKVLGYQEELLNEITVIPIGGYSQFNKVSITKWAFSEILRQEVMVGALFDRDYRTDEEIENFTTEMNESTGYIHVLFRKEIENYLIELEPINKAIIEKMETKNPSKSSDLNTEELLKKITEEFKEYVSAQLLTNELHKSKHKRQDVSIIISEHNKKFESSWKNLDYRFKVIPGKIVLSKLNEVLQSEYNFNITNSMILKHFNKRHIHADLSTFFEKLLTHFNLDSTPTGASLRE